ncbi:hypothetical protein HF086_014661 [Spodoptera exigua]|uniref:Peptidase M28 domain-containing protein n=1 Tax=Spodoptera exigua TaxID=7107 RepID=A0A922SLG6_SPOEX|nr:hypothetical protein HF086_014661 [Spodoptera exigua]
MASMEFVKENRPAQAPLSVWWIVAGLAANAALLAGVALLDAALPEPLGPSAPPERFHGLTAHRHLTNLTAIGPRVRLLRLCEERPVPGVTALSVLLQVAGSYENEVLAVGVLVAAVKDIAAHASPHNRLELDVQTASGAFALSFMDGMNNVYRDVQNVVVRVRGAGGRPAGRSALLLNCHFDTVPDSPGKYPPPGTII